jgi:trk system potassium uptake protein
MSTAPVPVPTSARPDARTVRRRVRPARQLLFAFIGVIVAGTLLLMLPVARAGDGSAPLLDAMFTATSAVTVTGLTVVNTGTYWSGFGEVVILGLIQLGGLGVMTFTALLVIIIGGRLGMRRRRAAQAEQGILDPGELRRILIGVVILTAAVEAALAAVLFVRFLTLGDGVGEAAWLAVFHGISAFNGAGFSLFADSLAQFSGDVVILATIGLGIVAGGVGVPVWADFTRRRRKGAGRRRWSFHTRITLIGTGALLAVGFVVITAFEWTNPSTFGNRSVGQRLMNGAFEAITPRSAGFSTVNYGEMRDETLFFSDFLMLVGGGSVSPAGGIKVTTMMVLVLATVASLRGAADVQFIGRRLPFAAIRQALSVTVIFVGAITVGTIALLIVSDTPLQNALFEATSAFTTTGLSTGITPSLPAAGDAILIVMMTIGRLAPQLLGAALVLRETGRTYRYPEERPIVG